jgi:cytochrome c-type biogenesis protein CcmH/NrfF
MRLLAVGLLALALAAPQTTLPDIEDEVMCVECGTALNVSSSPVADQERQFIRDRIAEGKSKEEIKAALVEQYGDRVLGVPEGGGIATAAWLVPVLLGALALLGVGLAARRWRRTPGPAGTTGAPELEPEERRRLEAELSAFDR